MFSSSALQLIRDHHRHFGDSDRPANFLLDAAHGDAIDSTGRDGEKRPEAFVRYVQRKAVKRDPPPNADADGGELAVFHPDAGESVTSICWNAEALAGADDGVLQSAEVGVEIFFPFAEVEDRVADELAGAVIGGLAAAADFENRVGQGVAGAEGGLVAQSSDRVDRSVFEQEQGFDASAFEQACHGGFLDPQSFRVIHVLPQINHLHAG